MDNKTIAGIFAEIGDILDIKGEDFFRINAYRKGALIISSLPYDLRDMVENNPSEIAKISGVGEGLRDKIVELVQTGKCKEYEKIKKTVPSGLVEMLKIRTLGPKKVKMLYSKLGIKNINELKKAAESGKIRELPGMGEKSEADILRAIKEYSQFSPERKLLIEAYSEASRIIKYLKQCKEIKHIEYAGSLRRRKETIGDIDILVTVKYPKRSCKIVSTHFVSYDEVLTVIAEGDTKSSVILSSGIQVDLRVIDDSCFGAALHYFTGNKDHNIAIRELAKKKGLKISEYGVFKNEKFIAGKTEDEVFKSVGLPYIIPEIRRNEGEIEYGLKYKKFPKFVELKDIKGDLHCHSVYSDGKNSIEEMAKAYIEFGYEYFAMTDHSSLVKVANGMSEKDTRRQWLEIDKLNKKFKGKIRILKGAEVDILKDGDLDFGSNILKELDVVIISAHLYSGLDEKTQTARLISAIENPYAMILAHPTGRLINQRGPINFDMKKVINACIANKVAIEINSHPLRLDLTDRYLKMAKDMGAKFVVNTDAHSIDQPLFMDYGVGVARRGWLTKGDVLNTCALREFDTYF